MQCCGLLIARKVKCFSTNKQTTLFLTGQHTKLFKHIHKISSILAFIKLLNCIQFIQYSNVIGKQYLNMLILWPRGVICIGRVDIPSLLEALTNTVRFVKRLQMWC